MGWTADDIADSTGKVVVITGANSGLGFETALALANSGAHVVLAVRSAEKGEAAMARIREASPSASLELGQLDLADLESIEAFAERLPHERIDVLINNAGVMALPFCTTAQGFEMQFGTNHLGHFALTGRLHERIPQGGRIVNLASLMHRMGRMRFDNLNGSMGYQRWVAYGQSKLSNLLFTYEASRRMQRAGRDVAVIACHPGYSSTHLQSKGAEMDGSKLKGWFMSVGNALFAQSAQMGALPTLYAATHPELHSGAYIGPGGIGEMAGPPRQVQSNARSHDEASSARLWDVSMELTGVQWLAGQK